MPYDYYAPTVNSKLFDRTCIVCGLYFCSQTLLKDHTSAMHPKSELTMMCRRIKPYEILQYREKQALCLLHEDEDIEWIDVENLETDEHSRDDDDDEDQGFLQIENISEWVASPWEEEK